MSPKVAVLVIVLALAMAGGAWLLWAPETSQDGPDEPVPETPTVVTTEAQGTLLPVSIYLPGADGLLHGEMIEVPPEDGEGRVRALVEALLDPATAGEDRSLPLPVGTELGGVYFMGTSSVALDLRLGEGVSLQGFGSKDEILSVYSLVNSVVLNSDRIERVVLMVDGQQPETLAGHVDLTRPLEADPGLITASADEPAAP